jgi:hypothetical protein
MATFSAATSAVASRAATAAAFALAPAPDVDAGGGGATARGIGAGTGTTAEELARASAPATRPATTCGATDGDAGCTATFAIGAAAGAAFIAGGTMAAVPELGGAGAISAICFVSCEATSAGAGIVAIVLSLRRATYTDIAAISTVAANAAGMRQRRTVPIALTDAGTAGATAGARVAVAPTPPSSAATIRDDAEISPRASTTTR